MISTQNLIRLPKNVFAHQIKQMKTNDEIIQINMTNNRLKNFNDENLKEKARKNGTPRNKNNNNRYWK